MMSSAQQHQLESAQSIEQRQHEATRLLADLIESQIRLNELILRPKRHSKYEAERNASILDTALNHSIKLGLKPPQLGIDLSPCPGFDAALLKRDCHVPRDSRATPAQRLEYTFKTIAHLLESFFATRERNGMVKSVPQYLKAEVDRACDTGVVALDKLGVDSMLHNHQRPVARVSEALAARRAASAEAAASTRDVVGASDALKT